MPPMTIHTKSQFVSAGPGAAALYCPVRPGRLLVLAHGFPWPDESQSDSALAEYALAVVERWKPFAEDHGALIVAPVFGGLSFPRYREMAGRVVSPATFVNHLVEQVAREHLARYEGRFSLHGHSAGAQFAARYLVSHPGFVDQVVLSAPSTYPMPDAETPWPYGMARSAAFVPESAGWLAAASEVRVTVLVGSQDTEPRPDAPGQAGSTRIERASGWIDSMRHHAEARLRTPTIQLVLADGLAHDEDAMTLPAQEILAQGWRSTA